MSHDDRKRAIGKVVSVAADRFVVEMHVGTDNFTVVGFDDVHYVARLGSFLMIPSQSEYVVVEVVGLRERDASTPSERGDFDRAGSSKYLDVVPVGMLPMRGGAFRFGALQGRLAGRQVENSDPLPRPDELENRSPDADLGIVRMHGDDEQIEGRRGSR